MPDRMELKHDHPLRRIFRRALDYGLEMNTSERNEIVDYLEDEVLCEFIHVDRLYKIRDAGGRCLDDIADMLEEGDILMNADSLEREFRVHKHIGDYTLFMLGMFPSALARKRGKEFILGKIVVPGASLLEHYMLQGQRSYMIASEFTGEDLFQELSINFPHYKNILEFVRIYLESAENSELPGTEDIITGTA